MAMPSTWVQVWQRFYTDGYFSGEKSWANQLWYSTTDPEPSGFSIVQLAVDVFDMIHFTWPATCAGNCVWRTTQFLQWNGIYQRQFLLVAPLFSSSGSNSVATQMCSLYFKRTAVGGRNGTGRYFGAPVPKSFLVNTDNFTTTAVGIYRAYMHDLAQPVISQGRTWYPGVHSLQDNSVYDITSIDLFPRPSQLQRRYLSHRVGETPPFYPNVF